MIKLIVGAKGSGKTKTMVDQINEVAKTTKGNVVVIEKSMKLTYDIDHNARLIDLDEYKIEGCDMLYGFLSGVMAGNYDITHMFIDGVLKVCGRDYPMVGHLLEVLDRMSGDNMQITVTVSADASELPEAITKYM